MGESTRYPKEGEALIINGRRLMISAVVGDTIFTFEEGATSSVIFVRWDDAEQAWVIRELPEK